MVIVLSIKGGTRSCFCQIKFLIIKGGKIVKTVFFFTLLLTLAVQSFSQDVQDPQEFLQANKPKVQPKAWKYLYSKLHQGLYNDSKQKSRVNFALQNGGYLSGQVLKTSKDKALIKNYKKEHKLFRYDQIKPTYLAKYLFKKYPKNRNILYLAGLLFFQEEEMKWARRCFRNAKQCGYKNAGKYLQLTEQYFSLLTAKKKMEIQARQDAERERGEREREHKREQELAKKREQEERRHKLFGQWLVDFEQAQKVATQYKRPILANFTGSDWCGWCMKLEEEVFSKPEFQEYALKSLVRLKLDYPKQTPQDPTIKKNNAELALRFGIRGYPKRFSFLIPPVK